MGCARGSLLSADWPSWESGRTAVQLERRVEEDDLDIGVLLPAEAAVEDVLLKAGREGSGVSLTTDHQQLRRERGRLTSSSR